MLGKKSGISFLVLGAVLIILGVVLSYVIDNEINKKIDDIWVYKYDHKFDDPTYEDCTNTTQTFYMYNITNVLDFIHNGSKMELELKGPYNYTQKTCKYAVTVVGNVEFSRQWVTEPKLIETATIKKTDRFYTINMGYNALMRKLRKTAPTVHPEFFLAAQVSGSILTKVLGNVQSNTTIAKIQLSSSPTLLRKVQGQFLAGVLSTAQHVVKAGQVGSEVATKTADQFFNNVTYENSISHYAGVELNFIPESIHTILYGSGTQLGVLNGTSTGSGVGVVLGITDISKLNATQEQFNALIGYLKNFTNPTLAASVASTQKSFFYSQWVASNVAPITDLNADGVPDLELANSTSPTGIPTQVAAALWNSTSLVSLVSTTGFGTWYLAATNATIRATLATSYGLTDNQTLIIAKWTVNFNSLITPKLLMSNFGITNMTDLAYAQWGLGTVFGGASLYSLNPGVLAGIPEISLWSGLEANFTATKSKALLTDPVNGLMQVNNVLGLLNGYTSAPYAKWNITVHQATLLASYFNYFIDTFSDAYITSFFANYTSGPIVYVTPFEFIWSKMDPLLEALKQNPNTGFFAADVFPFVTKEMSFIKSPVNVTIFNGGTPEELAYFLHVHRHKYTGNTTLQIWEQPYKVNGWRGTAFPRGFEEDTFELWFNLFLRNLPFNRNKTLEYKGVTLNKYDVSPTVFQNSTKYPPNKFFFQNIDGLVNLTSYYHPEMFGGYTDYMGIPEEYSTSATIISEPATWSGISIGVEPETSVTLKYFAGLCAYIMYHPTDRYFPGMSTSGMIPSLGQYQHSEADDDDIAKINTVLKLRTVAFALKVAGPVVGCILVVVGVVVLIRWKRSRTTFVKQIDNK